MARLFKAKPALTSFSLYICLNSNIVLTYSVGIRVSVESLVAANLELSYWSSEDHNKQLCK